MSRHWCCLIKNCIKFNIVETQFVHLYIFFSLIFLLNNPARVQLKKQFQQGIMKAEDPSTTITFVKKYIVDESTVKWRRKTAKIQAIAKHVKSQGLMENANKLNNDEEI